MSGAVDSAGGLASDATGGLVPDATGGAVDGVAWDALRRPSSRSGLWLVSRRFDLFAFGAPAAVALLMVATADRWAPAGDTPLGFWLVAVLFVDVGHVWSTLFRTYLDPEIRARRRCLLVTAPLVAYAVGVAVARMSFAAFWTLLAYVAVFHFVRQQYGWAMLYNRRDPRAGVWDRRIDAAVIYAATGYPLLWWHAHLPRDFVWFMPGDFVAGLVSLPGLKVALVFYVVALGVFAGRQVQRFMVDGRWRAGKILLVGTTAACWGAGIIATNTDFAFTVTNVLIHGVPYLAYIYVLERRRGPSRARGSALWRVFVPFNGLAYFAILGVLAYGEEFLWDRTVWHERPEVFWGPEWSVKAGLLGLWMPLLAVPQVTHYVLDGFIWRASRGRATGPILARAHVAGREEGARRTRPGASGGPCASGGSGASGV